MKTRTLAIAAVAMLIAGLCAVGGSARPVKAQTSGLPPIFAVGKLVQSGEGVAAGIPYVFRIYEIRGEWIRAQIDREATLKALKKLMPQNEAPQSEGELGPFNAMLQAANLEGELWINLAASPNFWREVTP